MRPEDGTYLCRAGESFDSVALSLYGDEKYAGELLAANLGLWAKQRFSGGETLRVPEIEVTTDRDGVAISVAPWKE